jgi:hypothetical protein
MHYTTVVGYIKMSPFSCPKKIRNCYGARGRSAGLPQKFELCMNLTVPSAIFGVIFIFHQN